MKKKSKVKSTHSQGTLDEFRQNSLYNGPRFFFGFPFYLAGSLMGSGAVISLVIGLSTSSLPKLWLLASAVISFFIVMFILSIPAVLGAIFDIADCAIRADKRDAEKAAREAYETYQKNQLL